MNAGINMSAEGSAPRDVRTPNSADGRSSVAVFVVGPGRSGTSVLTRGLQALGVDLGETFKSANKKNPTGFFEDRDLLHIGKQARATLGLRAESVALVDADDWQTPGLEPLREKAIEIARTVAKRAPLGVQATIRSAQTAAHQGVDAAVEELLVIARELMDTEDAAEGVRSFIERREGDFKGR